MFTGTFVPSLLVAIAHEIPACAAARPASRVG
jgi:hypothetical protein